MPRRSLRARLHQEDASGHPLGTALRACRRMPTAVCTFAHYVLGTETSQKYADGTRRIFCLILYDKLVFINLNIFARASYNARTFAESMYMQE